MKKHKSRSAADLKRKTKNVKNKMGNPNFESKYFAEFTQQMLGAMRAGKSVVQFCSEINIGRTTFYRWLDENELRNTFELAQNHCEAHWETWLKNNLSNKEVNSVLVKMFFANRFGWSDKTESKEDVTVTEQVVRMKKAKNEYVEEK